MSRRACVVLALAGWTVALWGLLGRGPEQHRRGEALRERERLVANRERELRDEGDALVKREKEVLARMRSVVKLRKAMREGRLELDWEEQLVPPSMLIPDGEWWARADGLFVLLSMQAQRGIAVIATADGDSVLDVLLRDAMSRRDQEGGGELIYEFSNSERELRSSWIARVKAGRDDLDHIVVDRVEGTFYQPPVPFTLFLTKLNDPQKQCSAAEMRTIGRIRGILAKTETGPDRKSGR